GRDAVEERIGERARHYGLSLGTEHRVLVAALEEPAAPDPAAGASRRAQLQALVAATLSERLPGALTGRAGDVVTAAVPTDGDADSPRRLTEAIAACRARLAEAAPGVALTAGIGALARAAADFPDSAAGATRCIDVLRRLGRTGETLAAD